MCTRSPSPAHTPATRPRTPALLTNYTHAHARTHTHAHTTCNICPPPSAQVRDVREPAIQRVAQHIQDNYTVGDQLKRELRQNILRLTDIKCYRGTRCARVLPVSVRGRGRHA